MGQYAEDIINGLCDSSGDYTYKCNYIYKGKYKDAPWEASVRKVRKELAILIKRKIKEYPNSSKNIIVNCCRKYINFKYGSGWRERGMCVNNLEQWKLLSEYANPEFDWNYELNKHKHVIPE